MRRKLALAVVAAAAICGGARAEEPVRFDVSKADVARAGVEYGENGLPMLEVELKQPKAEELSVFTANNLNRKVVVSIDGEVVAEPVVRKAIEGGVLLIQPRSESDAERLAKALSQPAE